MSLRYSLLLLLILASAQIVSAVDHCGGRIVQYVPAVVGEDGGTVKVTESLAPGNGDVYVTVSPKIGVSTQESIREAVAYAAGISGFPAGCDVLLRFEASESTDYIEGPSAGAAITAMSYALMENRSMRQDAIMTGTIEKDGSIGAVGGLYEKANSAIERGARFFIVPQENMFELLLLKKVQKTSNITVLQASDIEQVIEFMLDNKTIPQDGFMASEKPLPDPPKYDDSEIAPFRSVARYMMDLEKNATDRIEGSDDDIIAIKDFYRNEERIQERLLLRGYLFSAANEAFLDFIDISTIQAVIGSDADIARKKGDLGICLGNMQRPDMDQANMEWVIGTDLRYAWAYDKYNATDAQKDLLTEERYIQYRDLMYGEAWCDVAKGLLAAAPSGGAAVDEDSWAKQAEDRIKEAGVLATDPTKDTFSRLIIAEDSYARKRFGAAIYDAVYVREMETADKEIQQGNFNASERVDILLSQKRTSLWGRIYQSQGAYLASQDSMTSAYRILRFAKALDDETALMRQTIKTPVGQPEVPAAGDGAAVAQPGFALEKPLAAALMVVSILLIVGGIILLRRGSDGHKTSRYRYAHRAGKKESGAELQENGPGDRHERGTDRDIQ